MRRRNYSSALGAIRGGSIQLRDYPSRVKAFLESNKDVLIISITIARKPIEKSHLQLLNLISLGKLEQNTKRLGYDDLFHLSFEMVLDNGMKIRVEKNHVIQISKIDKTLAHVQGSGLITMIKGLLGRVLDDASKTDPNIITDRLPIKIQPLNLFEFFENGRKLVGDQHFFEYSAITNNCQSFISTLLKANNLYTDETKKFVLQSAKSLIKGFEWIEPILKGITNAAANLDSIVR